MEAEALDVSFVEIGKEKSNESSEDNSNYARDTSPFARALHAYSGFVARRPIFCMIFCLLLMIFFSFIGILVRPDDFPDFGDPSKGLETRGTEISGIQLTFANLNSAFNRGLFTSVPDYTLTPSEAPTKAPTTTPSISQANNSNITTGRILDNAYGIDKTTSYGWSAQVSSQVVSTNSDEFDLSCSGSLSEALVSTEIALVFKPTSSNSLFNVNALKATCRVDSKVLNFKDFRSRLRESCASRSLGNYVAYFNNKTSCFNISQSDVSSFESFLQTCLPAYNDGKLQACNSVESCSLAAPSVPLECWKNNWAFDSLHYLVDSSYKSTGLIKYARILPMYDFFLGEEFNFDVEYGYDLLSSLHNDLLQPLVDKDDNGAALYAYGFLFVKFDMFGDEIWEDVIFAVVAITCVFLIMLRHTGSLFVTVFSIIQILLSVAVAYGVYMVIFYLPFFPFLNLVAIFIVTGIGSDDVFVLVDAWKQFGQDLPEAHEYESTSDMTSRLEGVLSRAGISLLMTSITTAAAFFAVILSPITSLKCFGVYCGTVVLVDFIFCVSFIPAVLIVHEKYVRRCSCRCMRIFSSTYFQSKVNSEPVQESKDGNESLDNIRFLEKVFRDKISPRVFRYRFVLFILMISLAGGVGWNAFNLQLTESSTFQLFLDDHPMERYEQSIVNKFDSTVFANELQSIQFFFGLETEDDGNYFDPDDKGTLRFIDLDISDPAAQEYLVTLCEDIRASSFYSDPCSGENDVGQDCALGRICTMEYLKAWIEVPCENTTDFPTSGSFEDLVLTPARATCCGNVFPLSDKAYFNVCLGFLADVYAQQGRESGLIFDSSNGKLVTLLITVLSNVRVTDAYKPMKELYDQLKSFTDSAKSKSPDVTGLDSLNFKAGLSYFDLQTFLVEGAFSSSGISLGVALGVLIFMTRSPILTLSSVFTILAVVLIVFGILVFLGWDLNILESIIVSIAVGLAVDFTVHYSHSYLHSHDKSSREVRVTYMYRVMGVSVATGAFTTFMGGVALSFASTLFFYKFGIFLMITMAFSFLFSTILLPSILSMIGPYMKNSAPSDDCE